MTDPTYTKADIEAARAAKQDHRPANCRQRLMDEGKAYPKSNCSSCGSLLRASWKCPYDRNLPEAAVILAERDRAMKAQGYREALDAHGIDAPNPYEGER